jgi:hypothetical protein
LNNDLVVLLLDGLDDIERRETEDLLIREATLQRAAARDAPTRNVAGPTGRSPGSQGERLLRG